MSVVNCLRKLIDLNRQSNYNSNLINCTIYRGDHQINSIDQDEQLQHVWWYSQSITSEICLFYWASSTRLNERDCMISGSGHCPNVSMMDLRNLGYGPSTVGPADKCPNHQIMGIGTHETINKCCILVTLNTITWMEYWGPLYMERGMMGAPGNILLLAWTKPAQTVLKHPDFVTVELLAWNHIPK